MSNIEKWLFAAWRHGSIGSGTAEEDDKAAFQEWYNEAKEFIAGDEREWVSVKDRLPEIGQTVMVYTETLVFAKTHYRITDYTKYGWEGATNVTHWMPLPGKPQP
jgi:hypothetical protein